MSENTSIEGLTDPDLNEQGLLSSRQRVQCLIEIAGRVTAIMAFFLFSGLISIKEGSTVSANASLIISAIAGAVFVFIFNLYRFQDALQGKVRRVEGTWDKRIVGWGKSRRTIRSIGGVDVNWNLSMFIANLTNGTVSNGARYIVYYLPKSKLVVAYRLQPVTDTETKKQVMPIADNREVAVLNREELFGSHHPNAGVMGAGMATVDNRLAGLDVRLDQVFILHPQNRGLLTGETSTPDLQPSPGQVKAPLIIAALMPVVVFLVPFGFGLANPANAAGISLADYFGGSLVCLTVFMPCLGPVMLLFAAQSLRLRSHRKRRLTAWQSNPLVVGHVVKCFYGFERHSSKRGITLIYEYQSPLADQKLTSEETVSRDLPEDQMPQAGTPVIVLAYSKPLTDINMFNPTTSKSYVL